MVHIWTRIHLNNLYMKYLLRYDVMAKGMYQYNCHRL